MLHTAHKALEIFEDENFICIWYGSEKGSVFRQVNMICSIGVAKWHLGHYLEAEEWLKRAITLAEGNDDQRHKASFCTCMAQLMIIMGQYTKAEEYASNAVETHLAVGNVVWGALVQAVMGMIYSAREQYEPAQRCLMQGVRMWQQTHHNMQAESVVELGRLELALGNTVVARLRFNDLIREMETNDSPDSRYVVAALLGLGWTALAEGNLAETGEMFRKALASGKCAAWEKMEGIAGLAEVAAQESRLEEAVEMLALVVQHPFTAHAQREQTKETLDALREKLARDVFAERVNTGRSRTLESVLAMYAADEEVGFC